MKTLAEWSVEELMKDSAELILDRNAKRLAPVACFKVQFNGQWFSLQVTPYSAVQFDALRSKEIS